MEECVSDSRRATEKHYQQGYRWFKDGQWAPALEELRLCLTHNPLKRKYSRLYSQIAAQLIARHYQQVAEGLLLGGRFAEAIGSYQQALKLKIDPRGFRRLIRKTNQFQRGLMAMYEQARELLAQEKLTKARRKVLELLAQVPQWVEAQTLLMRIEQREQAQELYAQGTKLYRAGHHEEARRLLEESLVLDKDYSAPQGQLERMTQELIKSDYGLTPGLPLEESVLLLEEAAEVPLADNGSADMPEVESKR